MPRGGPGRPRTRPDHVVADKGYVVECCFNRLEQWRGLATRYGKTRESYQAVVAIASILLWI
ncbi:Mobile element protein [Actinosynnema pretiosum subsp. pretiosum]|uniref:Mobile element protein n=1 Tax=Actinosynnema pretiosum subsp. pretiosum TaxID=103721 RepID=A0A1U9Y7S5_9PSEU|nr:mobile element protein [Actinosynnema pretiosum subsp. pretiosum]AXX30589.1 Mobile element protein [Actinosynnema pretiosum subsp. pretiosum]